MPFRARPASSGGDGVSPGRTYSKKRSFDQTPEPPPAVEGDVDPGAARAGDTFVIHQHHARRLHFDLRLEMLNGRTPVLVSWAVPKNLPRKTGKPHLAIHVEDHPFDYGSFSGTIPAGNYGAGEVRIFDNGTYELLEQSEGKLSFRLHGRRLQGVYHLARSKRSENGQDEWLAFLKKQERPDPDPLPELSPMLATLHQEPFDNDEWAFEVKWDGVRALAVCSDETMLFSRNARDISAVYPELSKLHQQLVALDAVVDGEIVAMAAGRPSFERLQSRMNLQNAHEIARLAKTIPVSYIAFDLLYLDGRSLIDQPLRERRRLLDELVVANDAVQVSPATVGAGRALYDIAAGQDLEGIVAKKLACPYRPGRRSREWLKIKKVLEADVVVGGWSQGEGARSQFGALLVGVYSDRGLEFAGSVGTGFNDATIRALLKDLESRASDECPFAGNPADSRARFGKTLRNPRWVRPELVARVEYRELTSAGKLRAPSFKGLRNDMAPHECRIELLRPKSTEG